MKFEGTNDHDNIPVNDPIFRWYLRRVGAYQHIRTILHLDFRTITVSRSHRATHTFHNPFLSRHHATLTYVGGGWVIKDHGGLNGTYVNAHRIESNRDFHLVENDIIGFGTALNQQGLEDSIIYRLCKEPINAAAANADPEVPNEERACVVVEPNNHLAGCVAVPAVEPNNHLAGSVAVPAVVDAAKPDEDADATVEQNHEGNISEHAESENREQKNGLEKKESNPTDGNSAEINGADSEAAMSKLVQSGTEVDSMCKEDSNDFECIVLDDSDDDDDDASATVLQPRNAASASEQPAKPVKDPVTKPGSLQDSEKSEKPSHEGPILPTPSTSSKDPNELAHGPPSNDDVNMISDDEDADEIIRVVKKEVVLSSFASELKNSSTKIAAGKSGGVLQAVKTNVPDRPESPVTPPMGPGTSDDSEMSNDGMCYSQEDEVILISDDESYFSQKTSYKTESRETDVDVKAETTDLKEEACDAVENDDWDIMFNSLLMEDLAEDYEAATSEHLKVKDGTTTSEEEAMEVDGDNDDLDKTGVAKSVSSDRVDDYEELAVPGTSGLQVKGKSEHSDYFPQSQIDAEDSDEDAEAGDDSADEFETKEVPSEKPTSGSSVQRKADTPASPKKTPFGSFYSRGTDAAAPYDRLKARSGQIAPQGVVPIRPLPMSERRRGAKFMAPPSKAAASLKETGRGSTVSPGRKRGKTGIITKAIVSKIYNNRLRVPGGGSAIRCGQKSPTKPAAKNGKPLNRGKDPPEKVADNKSSAGKPVKDPSNGDSSRGTGSKPQLNSGAVAQGKAATPPETPKKVRKPTVPHRQTRSRSERLAEDFEASAKKPPKRSASPPRPPKPPKIPALEAGVPRKDEKNEKKAKIPVQPPKKAILLPDPPPPVRRKSSERVNGVLPDPIPRRPLEQLNGAAANKKPEKKKKSVRISEENNKMYDPVPEAEQMEEDNPVQEARNSRAAVVRRILEIVLFWKTVWLNEQENIKQAPPIVDNRLIKNVKQTFSSSNEYTEVFEPLLLLETWESITQDWQQQRRQRCPAVQLALARIQQDTTQPHMLFFHCVAVISEEEDKLGRYPQDGWLTVLEVPVNHDTPKAAGDSRGIIRQFAHVEVCHRVSLNWLKRDGSFPPLLQQLASKHKNKQVVLKYVLRTRSQKLAVNENRPLNLEMVSYLKPQMRIFQALHCRPSSGLGAAILNPSVELCTLSGFPPSRSILDLGNLEFNDTQRNIILKVTETVSSKIKNPKICLVQGPPGTGKTTLVAGLVAQLLFGPQVKEKRPQIILCAPSNGAIDEDVCRLLDVKTALGNARKIRLVRIGQPDCMSSKVKPYSVEEIVKRNIENDSGERVYNAEIIKLTTSRNVLKLKMDTLALRKGNPKEVQKVKSELSKVEHQLALANEKLRTWKAMGPEDHQRAFTERRDIVLKNADVIATTLGSCTQHGMDMFLNSEHHSFICIIDEATQCIEQEALIPLQFNVNKLVLVGDPKQLPATVLSRKANQNNLCQSLFERLYTHFLAKPKNPVVMLDMQYRMHPELCFYPSKAFYRNRLRTHYEVGRKYDSLPFVPYLFFNLRDSLEESTGIGEADFVVKLCEVLKVTMGTRLKLSIGVITFYQHQRRLIRDKLANNTRLKLLDAEGTIEVNTVDGFQGREKDIIVISTVRANGPNNSIGFITQSRRLNVAITRAKCGMFIVGHKESLMVSQHWRELIEDVVFRKNMEPVASSILFPRLQEMVTKEGFL